MKAARWISVESFGDAKGGLRAVWMLAFDYRDCLVAVRPPCVASSLCPREGRKSAYLNYAQSGHRLVAARICHRVALGEKEYNFRLLMALPETLINLVGYICGRSRTMMAKQ